MVKYIRHQPNFSLRYTQALDNFVSPEVKETPSLGLSFCSDKRLDPHSCLSLCIDHDDIHFRANVRVAWCSKLLDTKHIKHEVSPQYLTGVTFSTQTECFQMRMVEQLNCISLFYQKKVDTLGHSYTQEQAAQEWINSYADHFPTW